VEQIHHDLYSKALDTLKGGSDLPAATIFVCKVCGNTVEEVPDECPICHAAKAAFEEVQ
jgi:rubrerythrin